MFGLLGYVLLIVVFLGAGFLYVKNTIKLLAALRKEEYNFITIVRSFGIFFVFLGIVMGLV